MLEFGTELVIGVADRLRSVVACSSSISLIDESIETLVVASDNCREFLMICEMSPCFVAESSSFLSFLTITAPDKSFSDPLGDVFGESFGDLSGDGTASVDTIDVGTLPSTDSCTDWSPNACMHIFMVFTERSHNLKEPGASTMSLKDVFLLPISCPFFCCFLCSCILCKAHFISASSSAAFTIC